MRVTVVHSQLQWRQSWLMTEIQHYPFGIPSPPLSPPSRSEDSLFQALTSLKHHNDFLWIKFKIATFLRQATDAQLQRIADWHSMTLQELRARASYIVLLDAWGTCTDIHVYASMTETSIRVREESNRNGRYNPIDREGNAIEDSIVTERATRLKIQLFHQ